ncbi:MAG: NAD(P)/FAD-dependent oxidoreductase [Myxococcota bacterium]|jgi:prolycopene isomerase|nr:NAD(P)/FAD-dependent oxidoreductase [Myxococcota bacterium]
MGNKVDAIVVGAGLGGLTAALTMARKGLRVLVLERNGVPGGCATSFVRGRYEFEVSLHQLSGVGLADRPGRLYPFLEELGVMDEVEFIRTPAIFRSVFPDLDITLPAGWEPFTETLCDAFPDSADGIRRFMSLLFTMGAEVEYFYPLMTSPSLPPPGRVFPLPFKTPNMMRYAMLTWGQVLDRHVDDERVRAVLSQLWSYLGLPPSRISFTFLASAMASYIDQGPLYVRGRSQALSNGLVRLLERAGGEIRLNQGVREIRVADGKVVGVVTDAGEEIPAATVVSNVDPVTTCRELMDPELVPNLFWHRLRSNVVGPATMNLYLGLAKTGEELGLADHEVFVNEGYDVEERWQRMKTIGAPAETTVTHFNAVSPDISPPGTAMVVVTSLMYGEPWFEVAPQDYVATKQRMADQMLRLAERVAPDLRDAIEVIEIATPLTNMRYIGQLGGAVYGFEQTPGESTLFRLGHRGPLGGLYFAGAFTQPGGGFEPAMLSGCAAGAKAVHRAAAAKAEA